MKNCIYIQALVLISELNDYKKPPMQRDGEKIRHTFSKKGDDCEAFSKDELVYMFYDQGDPWIIDELDKFTDHFDIDKNGKISCKGEETINNENIF